MCFLCRKECCIINASKELAAMRYNNKEVYIRVHVLNFACYYR